MKILSIGSVLFFTSVALAQSAPATSDAPATKSPASVAIVVAKQGTAPTLFSAVQKYVEAPLAQKFTVVGFSAYRKAVSKAKLKLKDVTVPDGLKAGGEAAKTTHVLLITAVVEPDENNKPVAYADSRVLEVATEQVVWSNKIPLDKRQRLTKDIGAALVTEVEGALIHSEVVAPTVAEATPAPTPEQPAAPPPAPAPQAAVEPTPASAPIAATEPAPVEPTAAPVPTETIAAQPAPSGDLPPPSATAEAAVLYGFTLREVIGYGALAAGGVLAVSGIVVVATRNDMKSEYNETTNVLTITKRQSRVPGYTMLGVGLGVAAAGAFLLWVEPKLELGLMNYVTLRPDVAPTQGGAAFALSGSF